MRFFTKNLLFFAIGLCFWTILFRFGLSYTIEEQLGWWILTISLLYGLGCFLLGWLFGRRDRAELPLYDIGFRFNFMTFLICSLVGELWFVFDFNATHEPVKTVHITTLWWGVGIFVHFIFYLISRKRTIKGLDTKELFE
jgi:hypothetical protein